MKRMLFFIVLAAMFIALTGCGVETPSPTPADDSALEQQDFIIPDWVADYQSIIEEYRKFADYLINEGIREAFDDDVFCAPDYSLEYEWYCMMGETNIRLYGDLPKTRDAFGYALEDLNGNGNDDLILLLQDYTVLAIFSTVDGKPKLLDAFWPRHRCAIYATGLLYTLGSNGADYWEYALQRISQDGSEFLQIEIYGCNGYDSQNEHPRYYRVIDGETIMISGSEFEEFQEKFPVLFYDVANEITKNSGIEFIKLFD